MFSIETARQMENASGALLQSLCQEASQRRDRYWGSDVTYSRKVFIPLTNMCRDSCRYCTFVKTPESGEAALMTPDQVLTVALKGQNMGCKEALFSLGERPEKRYKYARDRLASQGHTTTVGYLKEMAELVLEKTMLVPHINAGALSRQELEMLKPVAGSMGMMLESTSTALMKKGQAHYACPDKEPARRLETLLAAGELGIPFTTGLLIGIGESWQDRIDSLIAINEVHQRYGHIQEVIVQNFRAKKGTSMADFAEPSKDDMLRTLAIARLLLDPSISLQAPPNLAQDYKDYLSAGINDWGGISPLTKDFINPERAWPQIESLSNRCSEMGYRLRERLTVYPSFLNHAGISQPATNETTALAVTRIHSLAAVDGLALEQCL
jgi:FO synthase